MKFLHALVFAFALPALAHSAVDDKSPYNQIPAGSVLKFKYDKEIHISPKQLMAEFSFEIDGDADGVEDVHDWCPATAPGLKVWKFEDFQAKKCRRIDVGCSGKDEWLYTKPNTKGPLSKVLNCEFQIPSSGAERILPVGVVFNVSSQQFDDGTYYSRFFGSRYQRWIDSGRLLLETSKQKTVMALSCRREEIRLVLQPSGAYVRVKSVGTWQPTVGDLRALFEIELAGPVVID